VLVTVSTVPKGRVGLAHRPGEAAEYQVAWPRSLSPVAAGEETATVWATVGVVTGTDACSTTGVGGCVVVAIAVVGAEVVDAGDLVGGVAAPAADVGAES
jgi:hypothetical protein